MSRILTIIAAVIVGLGVLVGIYFFFFYDRGPSLTATGPSSGNPFGAGSQTTSSGTSTSSDTSASSGDDTSSGDGGNIPSQVAPKLTEITQAPVGKGFIVLDSAGTPFVDASGTTSTVGGGVNVRYIDRESGNLYDYNATGGGVTRVTNHTVPGVEEVSWLPDGSSAYVRFIADDTSGAEHINTYRLPADGTDGSFLAQDLSQVIPLSGSVVFTLAPNTSGSVGYTVKPDGTSPVTLFSSLFSSLTIKNSTGAMVAYTKPSADLAGYAFLVDRKSGAFSTILGPLPGLSALPNPAGSLVLVSYLAQGSLQLAFYDTRNHQTVVLPIQTLTDKCVWSPDSLNAYCAVPTSLPTAMLPDSWYQGATTFSDRIWKIDFTARVATLVADLPTLTTTPIDATGLAIDQNENTLVFMNKQDDSLWAYSL